MMKVVLHGFGNFPVLYRHLIEEARVLAPEISWAIILPTIHHKEVMRQVLDPGDILSLEDELSRSFAPADLDTLANYRGNLYLDIETEKRLFKNRASAEQVGRAVEIYVIYREFLRRVAATQLFVGQVEGFEGKVLLSIATELGIRTAIPTSLRNLGGFFFSPDAQETLPIYRESTPGAVAMATRFVAEFRNRHVPAAGHSEPDDVACDTLPDYRRPFGARAALFLGRIARRPDMFEAEYLRVGLLNNLPLVARSIWGMRRFLSGRQFDIGSVGSLPDRFIFYPIQYSPESSINTPAPYYVDQMRAIDAIRFAMPSNYTLVVKEHPSGITVRPRGFIRALRKKAGVQVVHYRVNARDIIQRADLTVSVTGTATFEAFLLQRPSLTLGDCFIAPYLGGRCVIEGLQDRIRDAIAHPPTEGEVVAAVAELMSVRHDVPFRTPDAADAPRLTRRYVQFILKAYLNHLEREAGSTGAGD